MKKALSVLTSLILAGSVAAGCSSSDSGSAASPAASAKQGSGQKIKVTLWGLSDWKDFQPQIVDDFEKENPNIDIELTTYAIDPLKEALKVAASSATLPDMWFTWGGTFGSFYAENGLTLDLTQVSKDHKWSEIYNKSALDMSTYNNVVSGIPIHLNVLNMWYPKSVYEKLKLTPPATFADFESQLKTMKDNGVTPMTFGGKGGWHIMRLTEQLIENFGGAELHDKLLSLQASWNDPAIVKTFEKLKEYTDKGYLPKGYVAMDPSEAQTLFYQGKSGLTNEGTWFDGAITNQGFDPHKYSVFSFPNGTKRTSVFIEMFQINKKADKAKQEAAIKFGEYLSSAAVATKYQDKGYGAAAALNVKYPDATPNMGALLDGAKSGGFLIMDQALPQEISQKLFEAQDKVALNEWTPQQAAEALDKAVKDYKSKKK